VYRGNLSSLDETIVNTSNIPEGVYLVNVFDKSTFLGCEKFQVIH
jgi:hypothetical protein